MKVLVTGGAGFIGSHLIDRLPANGDDVCVSDNFSTGKMSNLSEIHKSKNGVVRVSFVLGFHVFGFVKETAMAHS
jgi:nucleoside-diphosphate-sugar epimerase